MSKMVRPGSAVCTHMMRARTVTLVTCMGLALLGCACLASASEAKSLYLLKPNKARAVNGEEVPFNLTFEYGGCHAPASSGPGGKLGEQGSSKLAIKETYTYFSCTGASGWDGGLHDVTLSPAGKASFANLNIEIEVAGCDYEFKKFKGTFSPGGPLVISGVATGKRQYSPHSCAASQSSKFTATAEQNEGGWKEMYTEL